MATTTVTTTQKSDRQYYIDWLRILLILSVFLFHIGMIFNSWGWHVKNDITAGDRSILWYIMIFLHEWRMPLLILISGAGTYFALGKRSSLQYLVERFKRLFIPLLVGIFTLVPAQVYIEKSAQYASLIDFYPHMFEGIYPEGNFSWHHLWFIAYLFFIALVISPFLNFLRSGKFDLFVGRLAKIVSFKFGANVFVLPLLLSQLLLRPFFPENTNALLNDWAAVMYFLLFFLYGYILLSNKSFTESIMKQRRLYLAEAALTTFILVTVPHMLNETAGNILWDLMEPLVAISCGLAALGYAKRYLSRDSKLRKLANEAIYPFYLLHQPIIVVLAGYMVQWEIAILWKVVFITLSSFTLTLGIYWFVIRRVNALRMVFGLKMNKKKGEEKKTDWIPELVIFRKRQDSIPRY